MERPFPSQKGYLVLCQDFELVANSVEGTRMLRLALLFAG